MIIIYTIFLIIIGSLIFYKNYKIEKFQYIVKSHKVYPVEYIPTKKENKILTTETKAVSCCVNLCKETPRCNGINFFLNECTLYKKFGDINSV